MRSRQLRVHAFCARQRNALLRIATSLLRSSMVYGGNMLSQCMAPSPAFSMCLGAVVHEARTRGFRVADEGRMAKKNDKDPAKESTPGLQEER